MLDRPLEVGGFINYSKKIQAMLGNNETIAIEDFRKRASQAVVPECNPVEEVFASIWSNVHEIKLLTKAANDDADGEIGLEDFRIKATKLEPSSNEDAH